MQNNSTTDWSNYKLVKIGGEITTEINNLSIPYSNNVSVIDGTNNTVIVTASVGSSPMAVAVNETTNKIYVTNYSSGTVSVIGY